MDEKVLEKFSKKKVRQIWKNLLTFLLKRILKFCQRIWILDRKLSSWPYKVWGVQDAPIRRYKRLKNEISTGPNRKFFSSLKKFLLPRVICRNFFTYPDSTYQDLPSTSPPAGGGGSRSPLYFRVLYQNMWKKFSKITVGHVKNFNFWNF